MLKEIRNYLRCRLLRLYLKSLSVISVFAQSFRGEKVALYSIDKAIGLQGIDPRALYIYKHLEKGSFFEFLHVGSLWQSCLNTFKRKRAVCFFELFSQHQLAKFFIALKVKSLISIDDYRHTGRLVSLAREMKISSVAIQHGCNFSKEMFPKDLVLFDKLIVWSDFFSTQYREFLPKQKTVVCEHPLYRKPLLDQKAIGSSVMVVQELGAGIEPFLLELSKQMQLSRYLRLQPGNCNPTASYRSYFSKEQLLSSDNLYDDLGNVSVVVGSYSSVLYQAILLGCGVVVCQSESVARPLLEQGVGSFASSPGELVEAIRRELCVDDAERTRRKELIWGCAESQSFKEALC